MELEKISVLVLLIGLATMTFVSFNNDVSVINENVTVDTSFNNTYNQINEESARINEASDLLFDSGLNSNFNFFPTIQSFIGVGSLLLSSLDVLVQVVQNVAVTIGLPAYVVVVLAGIFTILFLFAIYRATLGRTKI